MPRNKNKRGVSNSPRKGHLIMFYAYGKSMSVGRIKCAAAITKYSKNIKSKDVHWAPRKIEHSRTSHKIGV